VTGRVLGLVAAVVMVLLGGLWTLQGLGYVGGSSMTGSQTWAVVGPLVAGLGVALAITVLGRGHDA
jgi:hypothetical protein